MAKLKKKKKSSEATRLREINVTALTLEDPSKINVTKSNIISDWLKPPNNNNSKV